MIDPLVALLQDRVALAPMAGVTDAPVRAAVRGYGLRYTVAEMVNGEWLASGRAEGQTRAKARGNGLHIMQLAGCQAEDLAEGVRLAQDFGAQLIDLNMGCPAKRVTGGLAGSALMRDLDHAERLIAAAVKAAQVPVSVKMRLGWDDTSCNAPLLAARAERAGAALITVHGRTRQQFYKGRANWPAIRPVREATTLPLIANGDIVTVADARQCLAESGADAVMIGRGAQGRPWFPAQVKEALAGRAFVPPHWHRQRDDVLTLYEGHLMLYGVSVGLRCARKHIGWALAALDADGARTDIWRKRILTSDDPQSVTLLIHDAYEALGESAYV